MRRTGLLAAALCLGMVLAGCSDEPVEQAKSSAPPATPSASAAPSQAPAGKQGDPQHVAWMNDFCGAVGELVALSGTQPPEVQPGDLAGAKRNFSAMLGRFSQGLGSALGKLNALRPAPVPQGDQAKQSLIDVFTPVRQRIETEKAKLDAAPDTDQQALIHGVTSLQEVGRALGEVGGPLQVIEQAPELEAAGQQASRCQQLNR